MRLSPTSSTAADPAPETQRLFVAVWPPGPVVADLERAVGQVRPTAPDHLRWQPPERWHLTLVFVPRAGADFTRRIIAAVGGIAARQPPAPVTLTRAGRFPRVLWIAARSSWLAHVHAALCADLGVRPNHPFRAHLTLARARGAVVPPDLATHLDAAVAAGPELAWQVDHVRVVASVTGPQPRYTTLHRSPLTG